MSDPREKRVELILQQLEELPTLPAVAVKILEATGNQLTASREVSLLIESDPALTSRVLQLVHRADSGVRGEVTSVERAVVLLGFEAVRSAVLAISVFQTLAEADNAAHAEAKQGPFNREEFWKHCVAVACCAELLAETLPHEAGVTPSEAFICGLLHDIGKVALDATLPKSFSRVIEAAELLRGNIADIERNVIGVDHMVAGKRLCERWQLPALIRDCVWLHGQLPQGLPATVKNPRMVNLVTLADSLVREQHLGYSGNYNFTIPRNVLCDAIGLSSEHVSRAMQSLVSHIEPRAAALGLGQATSNELYQQALSQANRELGRVSGQLATKNRKLAVRAKFFDALSRFQGELRPDAPPQLVLQAIAQTAVNVLGVSVAGVFSLPPGQEFAETILCNDAGDVFQTSLIDLPRGSDVGRPLSVVGRDDDSLQLTAEPGQRTVRPEKAAPGDGPVLSAGPELEWLIEAIAPRLPHANRYWICLEADGLCIGGVVWGGATGESQRLSPQVEELSAIANGWALALRTAQIREEARALSEQLAEANRQLHNAQAEIMRSRMMTSVGEMAAGAAHEMNNPLMVISGRSQLLAQQLSDAKHKASANQIYENSHRLSAIITELMDFAKPEPPTPVEADVTAVLERSLQEAKNQTDPADRTVELTTTGDVPTVVIDARQVSAAITEVIDNAIHATDASTGEILIHAAFDPYSQRVVVTLSDNGCGMDENTVKRAFDPFFSNKPAGRRRGLGLAKALRWIEASGGSIRLESRPGQGTRAIILLPAKKADAALNADRERKAAQ